MSSCLHHAFLLVPLSTEKISEATIGRRRRETWSILKLYNLFLEDFPVVQFVLGRLHSCTICFWKTSQLYNLFWEDFTVVQFVLGRLHSCTIFILEDFASCTIFILEDFASCTIFILEDYTSCNLSMTATQVSVIALHNR